MHMSSQVPIPLFFFFCVIDYMSYTYSAPLTYA